MPINIKNQHVSQLVAELAQTMGESITDAVGRAVEDKLAEVRRQSGRQGIAAKLMALSERCAQNAPPEWRTMDYDAELYDERGLPR